MVLGEIVRSTMGATLPHFKPSHRASHLSSIPSHPISRQSKDLWRQESDDGAGVGTLEAVAADLHAGGSAHRVVSY